MIEEKKFFKRGKLLCGERHKVCNTELFKRFKQKHSNVKISYKDFYRITSEANLKIQDCIINDPSGFKIPLNIGYLAIQKFKPTHRLINHIQRRITGRTIFNLNLHTFEWMYTLKWFKTTESRLTSNLHCYQFKASRAIKARLGKLLKTEGGAKYVTYETKHFYSRKLLEKINKNFKFSSNWD